ncbi:ABC transporter ATP-binding protein [Peribacillus frigoritolerans]|jgi:NitT/TauT family transport system ATP-binding protein|uniref:ABC transporter ATP-binding protein n=1 Tax=Peribacillus frigoritolerans TaxID=450367 RepID=UPI002226E392|nr:ABC transporter ATP-binding protein [Peribacillus frigoritolerans]MCK2003660.1 ABC transporter ATP-binding protein [Peribacillus frigoritolerans]MCY9006176.1 ABC transporter ATP-binding protein [Peribacillus frigoritolerans]MED4634462.1 ABC transporter ATP-binding protein [Peribacillus frigoritolerans]UYY98479.1 ABC transporter ATP-binding protein [Peribacillus frigoritolerans]
MSFLKIQDIHHTYFSNQTAATALADISLDIEKGEFVSFLGPSGCGKTTLLSIIAGLFPPTSGKILLENKPLKANSDLSIGYMLQQDYLFPWKTIEENILLGLKLIKKDEGLERIKTLKLLSDVGLGDTGKLYPRELSGGMRQRAALARTLAVDPKILLLDEPFSALDYQTKLKLEDLVFETLKSFGKTAVLVTHDIGEAIAMSDRIFLFSANPGSVHKTFKVPDELRELTPFHARNHPEYPMLFQTIWKELESLEY